MLHNTIDHTILTLSLIEGIGPVATTQIVDCITKQKITDPSQLSAQDWIVFGCTPQLAQRLVNGLSDTQFLEKELELIEKHNVSWITIQDPLYPTLLKQIYAPPAVLYWRGQSANSFSKMLAIVGSRAATSYAQQVINQMVPTLISNSWAIVSGGR